MGTAGGEAAPRFIPRAYKEPSRSPSFPPVPAGRPAGARDGPDLRSPARAARQRACAPSFQKLFPKIGAVTVTGTVPALLAVTSVMTWPKPASKEGTGPRVGSPESDPRFLPRRGSEDPPLLCQPTALSPSIYLPEQLMLWLEPGQPRSPNARTGDSRERWDVKPELSRGEGPCWAENASLRVEVPDCVCVISFCPFAWLSFWLWPLSLSCAGVLKMQSSPKPVPEGRPAAAPAPVMSLGGFVGTVEPRLTATGSTGPAPGQREVTFCAYVEPSRDKAEDTVRRPVREVSPRVYDAPAATPPTGARTEQTHWGPGPCLAGQHLRAPRDTSWLQARAPGPQQSRSCRGNRRPPPGRNSKISQLKQSLPPVTSPSHAVTSPALRAATPGALAASRGAEAGEGAPFRGTGCWGADSLSVCFQLLWRLMAKAYRSRLSFWGGRGGVSGLKRSLRPPTLTGALPFRGPLWREEGQVPSRPTEDC